MRVAMVAASSAGVVEGEDKEEDAKGAKEQGGNDNDDNDDDGDDDAVAMDVDGATKKKKKTTQKKKETVALAPVLIVSNGNGRTSVISPSTGQTLRSFSTRKRVVSESMFADRAAQERQASVAAALAPGGRSGAQLRQRFHVFYGDDAARGEAYVCSAGDGCRILIHNVATGLEVHTLALPSRMRGNVTSLSVVGALEQVLFATDDGIIWRYDATAATAAGKDKEEAEEGTEMETEKEEKEGGGESGGAAAEGGGDGKKSE